MKDQIKAGGWYPFVFLVVTLGGLLSFAAMPQFTLSGLSTGFRDRDRLIGWNNALRMFLGDRDFGNIVIGKEGWIFWMDPGTTADYQRTDLFTEDQLHSIGSMLDDLSRKLQSRGIKLLLVIPPDKSTIYPQYVPDQIPVLGPTSRLDQFLGYMQESGSTPILDLRPVLMDASRKEQVYFRTDSHWNAYGAFLGYVEIMKLLGEVDPRLSPHSLSDFRIRETGQQLRDLPRIMKLDGLQEETYELVPTFKVPPREPGRRTLPDKRGVRHITSTDASRPSLLVFHDSFFNFVIPFVETDFSRVTTVPFRPGLQEWSLKWIEDESPDIVIIEVVERGLAHLEVMLPAINQ